MLELTSQAEITVDFKASVIPQKLVCSICKKKVLPKK